MELQPVRKYSMDQYPTKAEINSSPELLRAIPRRWQYSAAVGTMLIGLGLLAAPKLLFAAAKEAPVVARIAPIFPYPNQIHRLGLEGDFALPDFLSEEDARLIILEEAAKAGINFAPDVRVIEQVPFRTTQKDEAGTVTTTIKSFPITLDGTDVKRNISFEFVSNTDSNEWSKQTIDVSAIDSPAIMLREGISQGVPAGTYVVFYDPADLKLQGGVDLRTQVQQFISWLKAEGVI